MDSATSRFVPDFNALEKMLDTVIADKGESVPDRGIGDVGTELAELENRDSVLANFAATAIKASEDGLSAYIRGTLPPDLDYQGVVELLQSVGITYGMQEEAVLDALAARNPYKSRNSRRRRMRAIRTQSPRQWEVARGLAPRDPQPTEIEWIVPVVEGSGEILQNLLRGNSLGALNRCRTPLPLVRPGQLLARLRKVPGRPGRDIFGRDIPCVPPPQRQLPIGQHVVLDEKGDCCRAAICGYAALCDGEICVIPPIWIAPDNMQAFFVQLPDAEGGQVPGAADLKGLLKYMYIEVPKGSELECLCAEIGKKGKKPRAILVAKGIPPVPGSPTTWDFSFPAKQAFYFHQLAFLLDASRKEHDLCKAAKGLASRAVAAGEVIARHKEKRPGIAGRDVFGETVEPEEAAEIKIEIGPGASLSEDGKSCVADIFGFVGLDSNEVRVQAPVWVSPNAMHAYYVNFLQLGDRRVPSVADIQAMLRDIKVCHGIDEQAIGIFCEKMQQRLPVETLVPLARGEEPLAGEDARLDYVVDVEKKSGTLRDDGTMDFKEGQRTPQIAKGQVLATLVPATAGRGGRDIWGRDLPSGGDGRPLQVDPGKNVLHRQDETGISRYYAQIDGELQVEERGDIVHLAVLPILVIHGDVDYATGNIEFDGNVRITGVVKSGFSVVATDDVLIGDYVDDKASVSAGGKVAVLHGINGAEARVQAGTDLAAKFINYARVECGGNMLIDEYIYNAQVQCGGSIVVWGHHGERKTGAIIGGSVMAARKVRAMSIGSDTGAMTTVIAGVDMAMLAELRRVESLIGKYQEAVRQIKRNLGIESLNPRDIKKMIISFPIENRKRVSGLIEKMAEILELHGEAENRKKECLAKLEKMARVARIEVYFRIAANTQVRLGEISPAQGQLEDLEGICLHLREDRGRFRVAIDALKD